MDTTEKYIKMCEKAEEIQQLEPKEYGANFGNWYWEITINVKCPTCKSYDSGVYCSQCGSKLIIEETGYITVGESASEKQYIWLPRQDQLQEMVLSVPAQHSPRKYWNSIHVEFVGIPEIDSFSSWEQLLLVFVMHKKYQKTWNNVKQEWVDG
jgi:hypothetical protein